MGVRRRKFRPPEQLLLPWSPQHTISVTHAAEILDTSINTIHRLIEDGSIKAYKVRQKKTSPWRVNYDSLLEYIEELHKIHGLEKRFDG
jgi:excisionase family DNA binding protein